MAQGLLSDILGIIDRQKQTTRAGLGLLADNPMEYAKQTTARYFPTKEEETQYNQIQAAGGDVSQTPYYQKIFNLSQFQGSIKPIAKTPFYIANEVAQKNAVEMLGLPFNNTAADRARALGVNTDSFHGSKQDITGTFAPGYDDKLAFVTKSPEFASNWIGKGKFNARKGAAAEQELKNAEDVYRANRQKYFDQDLLQNLPVGDKFNAAYDKMNELAKIANKKEFGERGLPMGIHDTVYPLKVQANKTFNPKIDIKVMDDYFKKNNVSPSMIDIFKNGNYLAYESKDVVNYLKNKGYDSMMLRESSGDNYPTLAIFNPERVRSKFAAFDPARIDIETSKRYGVAPPDLLAAGVPLGLLATEDKKNSKK